MTDRELLEAAAKAARFSVIGIERTGLLISSDGCKSGYSWNPLTYDGDALRLAVKLKAYIEPQASGVFVCINASKGYASEPWGDNKAEATRRAIVRAAAQIGEKP